MQGEGGLTCCQGACDLCRNLQSCWAASSMVGPTHRSNEPPRPFLETHVCVYPETRQEGRALNCVHCPLTILYVLPGKEQSHSCLQQWKKKERLPVTVWVNLTKVTWTEEADTEGTRCEGSSP